MKQKPVRLESKIKDLKDTIWSNILIYLLILIIAFPYNFIRSDIIVFLVSFSICVFGIVFQIVKLNNLKKKRQE